jgi:hypothetical protein
LSQSLALQKAKTASGRKTTGPRLQLVRNNP